MVEHRKLFSGAFGVAHELRSKKRAPEGGESPFSLACQCFSRSDAFPEHSHSIPSPKTAQVRRRTRHLVSITGRITGLEVELLCAVSLWGFEC